MTETGTKRKIAEGRVKIEFITDEDLRDAIDLAAERERMTRTAWLTAAAMNHLPVDIAETIERR